MGDKTAITRETCATKAKSLRALANQFIHAIPAAISEQFTDAPTVDPLKTLADAPKVFKAQATKIGLLLVNKPLTPSAIHDILKDLEVRVVPAVFSGAAQVFGRKDVFGDSFAAEVVDVLRDVLGSVVPLADAVDGIMKDNKTTSKDDVMLAVGKVYSACDNMANLASGGVASLLLRKVKEQVELMDDAIAELKEWGEAMDEAGEDGESENADAESEKDHERSLEELTDGLSLGGADELPEYREDLKELLQEALRRADLMSKLCLALSKRRIKRYQSISPPFENPEAETRQRKGIDVLNKVIALVYKAQEEMDEMAGGFYESDTGFVQSHLETLTTNGTEIANLMYQTWDGKDDEFTKWLDTWKRLIEKKASIQKAG